jgi:hypothetical protein
MQGSGVTIFSLKRVISPGWFYQDDRFYDDLGDDEEGDDEEDEDGDDEEEEVSELDRKGRFRRAYNVAISTDTQGYVSSSSDVDRTAQELTAVSWAAFCTNVSRRSASPFGFCICRETNHRR